MNTWSTRLQQTLADASQFTPFTVEAPEHFLFREPVPVEAGRGDPIGQAAGGGIPRANGHEVDVRVSTLKRILEAPPPEGAAHPDDPAGIVLLAAGRGWPRGTATFDYWVRQVKPQVPLGGEIIYWERPGGGRVFNVGAIGPLTKPSTIPRLKRPMVPVTPAEKSSVGLLAI